MISRQRIDEVLAVCDPEEAVRIRILDQDVSFTLKAVKNQYSTANIKAWKAAEKELSDFLDQVFSDHSDSDAAGGESNLSFPNIAKVRSYLHSNGWKVSQSAIYKHAGMNLIRPDKDGRFQLDQVLAYAEQNLKRRDGSTTADDEDQKRKRQADIRKAEAQAKHWELKTKIDAGLYVPRDLFEKELGARALIFKADLHTLARTRSMEIIDFVAGNPDLAPDLIQFLIDRFDSLLDRYSRDPDPKTLDEV
jgi:hypothetical protein